MQSMILLPQSELEREYLRREAQRKERAQNITCVIIGGLITIAYSVMLFLAI